MWAPPHKGPRGKNSVKTYSLLTLLCMAYWMGFINFIMYGLLLMGFINFIMYELTADGV